MDSRYIVLPDAGGYKVVDTVSNSIVSIHTDKEKADKEAEYLNDKFGWGNR